MLTQTVTAAHALGSPNQASQRGHLLVVRHGLDRGPRIRLRRFRPAYYQPMFDDIAARWPDLGKRIRFWDTGDTAPNLDDVAAVVFLLQDPLRESFPDCYQDAVQLAAQARDIGLRIVNPPESLSNTIKTRQSQLWREAGIPTPLCVPFASIDQLYAAAAEMDGPLMIKADDEHAQTNTAVIDDARQLHRIAETSIPIPGSLSPLIDTRLGYASRDPDSPYATHFHKKRAMVFGNHVRANHVFFADQPIVGCVSSTFGHYRSINPIRRMRGNARCQKHVECDLEYHNSPCEGADTLVMAAKVLGTEFCAIDYSAYADGRIVLWEANPHFSLHRWPVTILGRQRKLKHRTPHIHESAARFFRDLLSSES